MYFLKRFLQLFDFLSPFMCMHVRACVLALDYHMATDCIDDLLGLWTPTGGYSAAQKLEPRHSGVIVNALPVYRKVLTSSSSIIRHPFSHTG